MDPQTGVVVLGLLSATAWGSADFGGGLAGRRAALFGVVLASQLVGAGLAAAITGLRAESTPSAGDLVVASAAGVIGAIGISALYRGLSVGRMGVVAPISGVLTAIVPVIVGIVLQGSPGPARLAGILLAVLAVVLVSTTAGGRPVRQEGSGDGLRWVFGSEVGIGLMAGIALGLFNLAISRLSPGLVFGPLVVVRATEASVVAVIILVTGSAWRVHRTIWPLVALVGGLDMAGNAFFILAAQAGRLDVAAVLSSLYPVATLILSAVVLRERIVGIHALGIGAAVVAIVLVRVG